MPRRLAPAASFVLLLGLFVYLFWVPLRPTAWDGPRGRGPLDVEEPRAVGRFARDVRLPLERFAVARAPDRPLAATAEVLLGFHALLAAARFAAFWLLLWRMSGRGWVATLGVVAAALPIIAGAPRHDEWDVGLLFFVTLLAATTPARVPWWVAAVGLPGLFALWANAHASALLGLGWLAVILLGRTLEWGVGRGAAPGRLLLALALCAGAVCLTPDGTAVFRDGVRLGKSPNIYQLPAWQPIDFSTGEGMPWGYLATLAVLLVAQLASPRALRPTALVVVLTFGFWPVLQQRGLGHWWLIVPWLAVTLVGPGSNPSGPVGNRSNDRRWRWAVCGLVVLAVVSTPFVRFLAFGPRGLEAVTSSDTPAQLALDLTTDGPHLPAFREVVRAGYPGGRFRGAILADAGPGDFLAWVLDGDNSRPVMIDSRPEAFDEDTWSEATRALDGVSEWWEILGRQQVNLVVVRPDRRARLAGRLRRSAEWAMVEDRPELLVAVRRIPKLPAEMQP